MLLNPGTLFSLRTSKEFLIAFYTGELFGFNAEINEKTSCFFLFWSPKFILKNFFGFLDTICYYLDGVAVFVSLALFLLLKIFKKVVFHSLLPL